MRPMRSLVCPLLAVLGFVLPLSGCAVTSLDGQHMVPGSDEFADYVELVFRRQNAVATELALALDDVDPASDRYTELEAAELDLLTACRGLNEIASSRRDGDDARGLAALRRARQAPDCERAAEAAAAAL